MLEVNVTVKIPGLPEAINNLAQAIGGKSKASPDSTPQSAAPDPSNPVRVVPDETSKPAKPKTSEPEIPLEEIGRAGAVLCEQGRTAELVTLLQKYGVQAVMQLRDKPAETRIAFAADLRALGAEI